MRDKIRDILVEYRGTDKYEYFRGIILDNIDFGDYGYYDLGDDEKLEMGYRQFMDEYGWNIPRMGLRRSMKDYLQGLPSWLDIPYHYYDIENLLYSIGFDEVRGMDDGDISDMYYNMIIDLFINRG